mmetsp:Transcript_10711/g.40250  ORF Transcript_10711/g.40250 Transcript_10711/m.40250 type:complete len:315 (-) Transcript_10711:63-1007(-)
MVPDIHKGAQRARPVLHGHVAFAPGFSEAGLEELSWQARVIPSSTREAPLEGIELAEVMHSRGNVHDREALRAALVSPNDPLGQREVADVHASEAALEALPRRRLLLAHEVAGVVHEDVHPRILLGDHEGEVVHHRQVGQIQAHRHELSNAWAERRRLHSARGQLCGRLLALAIAPAAHDHRRIPSCQRPGRGVANAGVGSGHHGDFPREVRRREAALRRVHVEEVVDARDGEQSEDSRARQADSGEAGQQEVGKRKHEEGLHKLCILRQVDDIAGAEEDEGRAVREHQHREETIQGGDHPALGFRARHGSTRS